MTRLGNPLRNSLVSVLNMKSQAPTVEPRDLHALPFPYKQTLNPVWCLLSADTHCGWLTRVPLRLSTS